MTPVSCVCVYCGSRLGAVPLYEEAARDLGQRLGRAGLHLVYGGGHVGLMGITADAVMQNGGRVTGIIPRALHDLEVGHQGLTELLIVEDMHERKFGMFERADAFIILPGGLGTLEEAFEVITWRQLGYHDKPILIVDVGGYWQPFSDLINQVIDSGFADASAQKLYRVVSDIDAVLPALGHDAGTETA